MLGHKDRDRPVMRLPRVQKSTAASLLVACSVTCLMACSVAPDFQRPEAPIPAAFRAESLEAAEARPPSRWWEAFGSDELNALELTALANNRDVQAAISRIAATSAQSEVAGSSLMPLVQAVATNQRRAPKGGGMATVTGAGQQSGGSDSTYQAGLQASYEIDLWGKNREAMASALANAEASVFDREVVALTLTADIANGYFQYLSLNDRIVVANNNIKNMREVQKTIAKRITFGEGTELERAQQRSVLAQAETIVPVLELQRDQAFNRIAILLGRAPENLTITAKTLEGLKTPVVKPGLPSDLLQRRPDIQKAEATLIGANADIGVARARLLPTFGLTAQMGIGSTILKLAISPAGFIYQAAASLTETLFDGGKIANEIAFAEAHYREMVQIYQKAVLQALQDVDNALASVHWTTIQKQAQAQAVSYSRQSHELSAKAFKVGTTDYLSVLESDRTRFTEEDKDVLAKQARLIASVDLFKALGGGFELAEKAAEPVAVP
ncbi:MAG: efflux transporter outer membrane subunit [Rhodospirillaceae bacterium]